MSEATAFRAVLLMQQWGDLIRKGANRFQIEAAERAACDAIHALAAPTKTKTMTLASKAEGIVDAIFLSGSQWGEHDWKYAQEIIAEALRRAEDDKLEEAACLCDGITEHLSERRTQTHASPYFARQIRNLKTEGAP